MYELKLVLHLVAIRGREGGREGERERGRKGGRDGGRKGWREGGREGGRDARTDFKLLSRRTFNTLTCVIGINHRNSTLATLTSCKTPERSA